MAFELVSFQATIRGFADQAAWIAAGQDFETPVDFSLEFNEPPVLDAPAAPAPPTHAFMIGFVGSWRGGVPHSPAEVATPPEDFDGRSPHQGSHLAIRSHEARSAGGIVARLTPWRRSYANPEPSSDIDASGYGQLLAVVPYEVVGNAIAFSLPAGKVLLGHPCRVVVFEDGVISATSPSPAGWLLDL